jgi:seryl-tRNA synthetase
MQVEEAGRTDQRELLDELLARGLLLATGVPGLYGRGREFERIRLGLDALLSRAFVAERAERMSFPPAIPRRQMESSGYLTSFPHLAGSIFSFDGSEAQAVEQDAVAQEHGDWSRFQRMTPLSLLPAACYPVYPAVAARGRLARPGLTIDPGAASVFRHEPSEDPTRWQFFHMRELVRIGEPDEVVTWRDGWLERGLGLLRGLGLEARRDVAADPFFGRTGRLLAASQREQELKYEIHLQIAGSTPTAIASFNCHQAHFAALYGLEFAGGGEVHTACLGFGHERIVVGLLRTHGFDPAGWPPEVAEQILS